MNRVQTFRKPGYVQFFVRVNRTSIMSDWLLAVNEREVCEKRNAFMIAACAELGKNIRGKSEWRAR